MSKSIENMNRSELRAACKAAGIKYGKMTVGEMRTALTAASTAVSTVAAPKAPKAPKPAESTGRKIEKDRDEQNGIKRPSAGTLCRQVWDALDLIGVDVATAADAKKLAEVNGWNRNNTSIEFYQWRRFNGVVGRQKK